jgi:hypothetical protein
MKQTLAILVATTTLTAPAFAEDLSVVGSWSSLPLHNQYTVLGHHFACCW